MSSRRPTDTHPLRELVFEYLERIEAEDPARVLAELCERTPAHAQALRSRVELLEDSGLAGAPRAEAPPERLGHFRLIERIGGGGMGVVYLAHDERLGREVALKLVRPSELYFPGARERFQREVEAVARLSHPGIVPVFSAGDESGVPFFAMERVVGCTLARALEEVSATGRAPGELSGPDLDAAIARATGEKEGATAPSSWFQGSWGEVCARIGREIAEALEHAHRRGVLHRDVKPSNVMITRGGRVMLVDFGLAAAEGVDRLTRTGSALGSLPYMSPEQLEGDWKGLDRRADVYALGVTLYELLTLRLPFAEPSAARLQRAVLEGRAEPVRRRNPRIAWELEAIVANAMEPERERRYASAGEVASDLSLALEGRPIRARRAGAWRRARRWAARHPAGAALLALTTLVVVGGPALFGWQQRRARLAVDARNVVIDAQRGELEDKNVELAAALAEAHAQRDAARTQGRLAEENFERAVAAVDTMLTRIAENELKDVPRLHQLRREVLEDALAFYREFLAERAGDAELRRETARAWRRVGELYGWLDRAEESVAAFSQSLELMDALPDRTAELALERADACHLLALPLRQLGRHAEAEEIVRAGRDELERSTASTGDVDAYRARYAALTIGLAQILRERGRGADAKVEIEALLPDLEEAYRRDPEGTGGSHQLVAAHRLLGSLYVESGGTTAEERARACLKGEEHHGRAVELLEPALLADPDDAVLRRELARGLINLGSAMLGRGSSACAEAEPLLSRGAELAAELRADYPGVGAYIADEAAALLLLGSVHASLGRYDDGMATLRRATAAFETLAESGVGEADAVRNLAGAYLQQALLAWHVRADAPTALEALDRAIPAHERAIELSPGMPQPEAGLEASHDLRTSILLATDDVEGACDAALAWIGSARTDRERVVAASRLALCATALEASAALAPEDCASRVAGYDATSAEILERALAAGIDAHTVLENERFGPLLARPEACAPLHEVRED